MRATLLEGQLDTTLWLEAAFGHVGIPLTVVETMAALERAARRARSSDFLVLDCSLDRPEDRERARQVVQHTSMDVHVVFARAELLTELAPLARGNLKGLDKNTPWPYLLANLRTLRAEHIAARVGNPHHQLSPQQRAIAALIAQDYSQKDIAAELKLHVGTVKRQVARIKEKWHISTTRELKAVYRLLLDDVDDRQAPGFS